MNAIATIAARRDDNLLALCDAIVTANEVGKLDTFTRLVNAEARKAAKRAEKVARYEAKGNRIGRGPKVAKGTKPAPKVEPKPEVTVNDWKSQPSSEQQQRYLPALAARKGQHSVRNTKTGELIPLTAEGVATMSKGYASKVYYGLKAMPNVTVKENVTVKSAPKAPKAAKTVAPIDWDTDGTDDLGYAEGDTASVIIHALDTKLYA